MAGLNPFVFRSGTSLLHRLDVRCKTVLVCLLSLTILNTGLTGCLACFMLLAGELKQAGLSWGPVLRRLKWFLLFLALIFFSRALTFPGRPLVSLWGLTLTDRGISQGSLVVLRFSLVMMAGLAYSATTRPSDLKSAVQWFLAPIPLVPEKRVAIMISLSLRFLPLIFQQAQDTSDAFHARCGNLRRNPLRRITFLALPLLKKTFASADHLATAMEARCYSEDRTDPVFKTRKADIACLAGGLIVCLGLVVLS